MDSHIFIFLGSFLPTVAGGLVLWGKLNERVSTLREEMKGKASHEIVEHQYSEIIARLDRIETRINGK